MGDLKSPAQEEKAQKQRDKVVPILFAVFTGAVSFLMANLYALKGDVEVLKVDSKRLGEQVAKEDLASRTRDIDARVTKLEGELRNEIDLLHDFSWKIQGTEPAGNTTKGRYESGALVFPVRLSHSDAFAEIFCDLRGASFTTSNTDGSFNLRNKTIIAYVRSEGDFAGDPDHPNGIQVLLKNSKGDSYLGDWHDASSLMNTEQGMPITLKIPDDAVAREVTGISIKFTIGSGASEPYKGDLLVKSIMLRG